MKKDFKKIVLALDGSEKSMKAAKKGLYLGKNFDLDVLAIYVLDESVYEDVIPSNKSFEHWKSILADEGHKTLDEVKKIGEKNDVKVNTLLLKGRPEQELIKHITKNDLVVMGDKGKNALDRIFLGSTTEKVMHHSDSSVLVVK